MWETIDKCQKCLEVISLIHRRSTAWTIAAPVFEKKRLQNCCLSCSSRQMSVYLTLELAFVWEECFLLFCSVWSCRKLAWGWEERTEACGGPSGVCVKVGQADTMGGGGRGIEGQRAAPNSLVPNRLVESKLRILEHLSWAGSRSRNQNNIHMYNVIGSGEYGATLL